MTTRYHYVTVRARTICEMMQVVTHRDAFISTSVEEDKIRELLDIGYRWVRTDGEWAVLEREGKQRE